MAERPDRCRGVAGATTILVALVVVLTVGAGSASAAFLHKAGVSERFGSDGTDATFTNETGTFALDSSRQRLYTAGSSGNNSAIRAFSLPGHTPIGGKFPIEFEASGTASVEEASGNIYMQSFFRGIYGWQSDGTPLNPAVFPISPDQHEDQCSSALDPAGHLWVTNGGRGQVQEYNLSNGNIISVVNVEAATPGPCSITFDGSNGDMYVGSEGGGIWRLTAASGYHTVNPVIGPKEFAANSMTVDPNSHLLYAAGGALYPNYDPEVKVFTPSGGLFDEFNNGTGEGFSYGGIALDPQTGTVYLGDPWHSKVDVFPAQIVPTVSTRPASGVTTTSLVANGNVDPAGGGPATACYVEWGATIAYGKPTIPCSQATPLSEPTDVSAEITGLEPGKTYHYRFVALNSEGKSISSDRGASTAAKPTIEGVYASGVTATGAILHGKINPEALETTYWFEYGRGPDYGIKVPLSGEALAAGQELKPVEVQLAGLNGGVYHFRLVAQNAAGTSFSEDQTFNFFAQTCPNDVLRQQTGSEYLPDCRGYELVSPGNAGNVIFVPEHAQPGPLATSPSRFAFGGELGGVTGTEPTNSLSLDTYVATRTASGWSTALVGLKGSEVLGATLLFGNQSFDQFIDFYSGGGFEGVKQPGHNLPYVWAPDGAFLGRWPLTQSLIPEAEGTLGAFQPSPDFNHLAFSSVNRAFAPNGLVVAPGSAYDYNTETGSTSLISRLPGGEELDIPQAPGAAGTNQYIIFPGMNKYLFGVEGVKWQPAKMHPAVSTDGSHILMSVSNGKWTEFEEQGPDPERFLYMRVNDAVTYDVGKGHAVRYVGMTPDGATVFFTSPEKLTSDDEDNSVDLYEWTEQNGGEIQLVSKGAAGTGNGENCEAKWISNCDALPVEGTYESDYAISNQGDIYFYSPEVLDPAGGAQGEQNLYRYHEGTVTYVASLSNHDKYCAGEDCSNGPLGRFEISPNGQHVAFLTSNQLTPYNNNEFQEMYTYDPSTETIDCVSCMPNGEPPTGDTSGSLQGIYMTEDGRTFFYSPDPLTPKDTNQINDVYEFAEGRPQLITPGTSAVNTQESLFHSRGSGLEGVSENGTDVYFSTYDSLVGQDENGQYLKFYDARTNGGFPFVPPAAPCEAADECHGEGSLPPSPTGIVSADDLGAGGDLRAESKHKKKHRKAHRAKKGKKAHAKKRRGHGGHSHG